MILCKIYLQVQMCCLAEREGALKEREERVSQLESLLASTQDQLAQCIEQEVQRRLSVSWGLILLNAG